MCGIIGITGTLPAKEQFERARDVLAHRGPNDSGTWYDEGHGVALGHRRLSIIDLSSAGHQPMHSQDGRYVIIFNGEIYNYLELKKELQGRYAFKSGSDTEVLLAAYAAWGEQCLVRLNGMFAFVIYDTKDRILFGARDRLGIKPLYYYLQDGTYIFASEIKGLLALGVSAAPNDAIVYEYLAYGFYDHRDETFFKDIRVLQPGHCFTFERGRLTQKRWWYLPDKAPHGAPPSREEAEEHLRALLADSIKLRFRSDVPVGVNISSGLDSTSLLFYAEQTTRGRLHLFSMCLPDDTFNECQFIEPILSADQRSRWHTTFLYPEEVMSGAHAMLAVQDQPYGGIPTIAYGKLNAQAAKEQVIVLLEGQGVDELLAGYSYYRVEFLQDLMHSRAWGTLWEYLRFKKKGGRGYGKSLFDLWEFNRMTTAVRSQDMTRQVSGEVLRREFVDRFEEQRILSFEAPFDSALLNAQYRDIRYLKLPRVLRFNDHASMAYGRELRLPYLDYRVVEFCFFLPKEYKIEFGRQKVLLRDAMKGRIPESAALKAKVTFGAVQTPWMRKYIQGECTAILNSDSFKSRPYWDHRKVMRRAEAFFQGEGDNSFFMWQWINVELWLRKYIDHL